MLGASITLPDFLLAQGDTQSRDLSILERVRTANTFKVILATNSKVFLFLFMGILTCGIVSTMQSFLIGSSLGLVFGHLSGIQGVTWAFLLAAILPHGIFEISSFMVIAALGFYFPFRVYRHIQGDIIDWTTEVKNYVCVALIAYVVLAVAATIETFLTPVIAIRYLHP